MMVAGQAGPKPSAACGRDVAASAGQTGNRMGEIEPICFTRGQSPHGSAPTGRVTFDRRELDRILDLYGRMVALGEWRDYAIDFTRETAVFSIFRRAMDVPLYRIEKDPRLARRQGAYCVVSQTGLVLKRGRELPQVLAVLEKPLRSV